MSYSNRIRGNYCSSTLWYIYLYHDALAKRTISRRNGRCESR
ncbi:hypothetical protein F441_00576 [Phytophthora nicotianae CJ01A1]|uniref:Uncharacterized protein n=2 Tax=Phytophthora nicotianae TaxID=4792 RepID=W2XY35_PHYNI|nr:hypothetical protein F444_00573 [Phytophthora nicotianae P1976]ETP26839.1 hypothetical protein F441_00576 [Phytophthora nicotianae CJ01A1]